MGWFDYHLQYVIISPEVAQRATLSKLEYLVMKLRISNFWWNHKGMRIKSSMPSSRASSQAQIGSISESEEMRPEYRREDLGAGVRA